MPFLPHVATSVVMYLGVAVVIWLFVWGVARRYRAYRRDGTSLWATVGGATSPWSARLGRSLRDVAAQTKVRERTLPAVLHLPLFYGTVVLFIGTVIVMVNQDLLRWFFDARISGLFYVLFEVVLDLAGLALVAGVGVALWRRLVMRPAYLSPARSTTIVLCGLLFMGLSGFGLEAYRIAAQPNEWAPAAFIGWSVSRILVGVAGPDGAPVAVYRTFWWLHAAAAFSLIVGVAWSGLSHLFLVPATVAVHDPARPRTKLTTPFDLIAAMESDDEVELVAGTAATTDLAPPERLAADACVACGRCHLECPASAAGRALSPRDLVRDIQRSLGTGLGKGAAAARSAVDFEEAVWSCTNCYACEQACPARIRHVDYVLDFRRALVDQNRLDEQKISLLQALDRNQNPYRLPSHERAAWLLDVPYAEDVVFGATEHQAPPDYLYWIGCAAAYDERSSQVARATMDLLRAAGVNFVTLGPAEPCCGEPAKRLGEEGRFQLLAMTAIEMIKETGAGKIVTHCPHGLNVFLHEYPALGFSIPALHHSELLADLLTAGRLEVSARNDLRTVYHEPCNLARAGHAAGAALGTIGGETLLPPRSGQRTFCCGGGAANSFYTVETEERRISALRYEELAATGAEGIAVSCPFCLTMLRDAAGAQGEDALAVADVAEMLRDRLRVTSGS